MVFGWCGTCTVTIEGMQKMEISPEIMQFLDDLKRPDKYTNIDHTKALVDKYEFTEEIAEQIRSEWVLEVFKRIPFTPAEN